MEQIQTVETASFSGYLEALERCIVGVSYLTRFEVIGLEFNVSSFTAKAIIKSAYPQSNPDKGAIINASFDRMRERVNSSLKLPEPLYCDVGLRERASKAA